MVKNLPANTGDTGDLGSIPGWGRSPGRVNTTHSSILVWEIPNTEEPGRLQSMGSQNQTKLSDCVCCINRQGGGRAERHIDHWETVRGLYAWRQGI